MAAVDLVPLAPLADVGERQLPELVRQDGRSDQSPAAGRAAKLWTATYLLMGLRIPMNSSRGSWKECKP